MNAKNRRLMTLVFGLIFCLFSLEQSAFAQSPNADSSTWTRALLGRAQQSSAQSPHSNCKQVKANSIEYLASACCTDTGTFTNGGVLNGTTEYVYSSAFVFTPDPNVVSYISDLTITTNQGQVKGGNVYIYNFVTGLWTAMAHINPNTSTGRFAGATGVLYFNGRTIDNGLTYPADIAGEICFAP